MVEVKCRKKGERKPGTRGSLTLHETGVFFPSFFCLLDHQYRFIHVAQDQAASRHPQLRFPINDIWTLRRTWDVLYQNIGKIGLLRVLIILNLVQGGKSRQLAEVSAPPLLLKFLVLLLVLFFVLDHVDGLNFHFLLNGSRHSIFVVSDDCPPLRILESSFLGFSCIIGLLRYSRSIFPCDIANALRQRSASLRWIAHWSSLLL